MDWPVVSWVFLFPLFKNGILFPLFQSVGTPPDCHSFSNMMDCGLGPFSANSLRTCAPSDALDVLKCDFLLHGQFFILPAPSVTGMVWLEPLAGENQGNKVRVLQPFLYLG